MQRYFINKEQIQGNIAKITGNDFHHIRNVMRMKTGTQIEICADEVVYQAEIISFREGEVLLNLVEEIKENTELKRRVTIAFGLTRKEKQEEVLRRITELGADGFLTVTLERSLIKIKKDLPLERWERIVKEASEQSRRNRLLKVYGNYSFKEFLEFSKNFDHCLFAYEEVRNEKKQNFKEILKSIFGKRILVLVGPEGGISPFEAKTLVENGFQEIGLGSRILRCETAPLYIMSAIAYETEFENES